LIDFFFEPKGIAVVGDTVEPYHGGRHLAENLTHGYKERIYPVNPKYPEVCGLKCYPDISDIEGPLDLALIFIPAKAVPQVLEDCITKGVRGAIVQSGGFAEVGPEGKTLQDQCLEIARKSCRAAFCPLVSLQLLWPIKLSGWPRFARLGIKVMSKRPNS
jgi:acyl-CoA synthetase (NDP forming)